MTMGVFEHERDTELKPFDCRWRAHVLRVQLGYAFYVLQGIASCAPEVIEFIVW